MFLSSKIDSVLDLLENKNKRNNSEMKNGFITEMVVPMKILPQSTK